jgi:hypothetical protein
MNNLEVRLSDMYQAVTGTVREEEVPALRYEPPRRGRMTQPTAARLRLAGFAPLAAAAAVVLVVALAIAVPHLIQSPPTTRPAAADPSASLPPYMVAFDGPADRQDQPLVVISAKNGRILGRVTAPTDGGWWVTALPAGSPTRFLLAAARPQDRGGACNTYLYTLTLSAGGKPTALTPWPVVRDLSILPTAVSADGSTVAFAGSSCRSGAATDASVIGILRGSSVKTWPEPNRQLLYDTYLTADGSELSFVDYAQSDGNARVLLLDTDAAPGNPVAAGKVIYTFAKGALAPLATISPDGAALYVAAVWGTGYASQQTGILAGYRIGGGELFRWSLRGLRTVQSFDRLAQDFEWVGNRLFTNVLQGLYLIDPVTGKATQYRVLPVRVYNIGW